MDPNQGRGRSPTQGAPAHISPLPSPHHFHDAVSGLDPAVNEHTFTTGRFTTNHNFTTPFLESTASQSLPQGGHSDPPFYQDNQFNQAAFQDHQFHNQTVDPSYSNSEYLYQAGNMSNEYDQSFSLSTSYHTSQHANINPADLSKLSPTQDNASPHLLSPDQHSSPTSTNGQFYTP